MKVCMFSYHECNKYYITARRVARSLAQAGYDVRIIALLTNNTEPYEEGDGYRIYRVKLAPLRRVMMRLISLPARFGKKLLSLVRKESNSSSSRADEDDVTSNPPPSSAGARLKSATDRGWYPVGGHVSVFHPLVLGYGLLRLLYRGVCRLWYKMARWLLVKLPYAYLQYLDYYYRGFRLARQEPADIYHAHDLITLPVAWLCSRLTGGKLVYDSHELWLDRWRPDGRSRLNRFIVMKLESFLIRRTDVNIAPGESVARQLSRRYHIAPTVILNAPHYRPFERSTVFRDKLGIPEGEKIVLYMGRISSVRGEGEAIRSLKYLSQCSLVIFGFGTDYCISDLKELIRHEGLTDRVYFLDAVPFDEVTRHAMSADVGLVLHKNICLNYYYVSPCKLFEYMGAGLPMVGSNFPDVKMYIEGYGLGVTCDPDNPRDIANAIEYILSDENRYNEMKENALEAAKIFSWENESKKLLALYEGLSSRKNV